MQLRFGPDDVEAFASVKKQLIDEFRPWRTSSTAPTTARSPQTPTPSSRGASTTPSAKAARKAVIKHRSWLADH